MTEYGQHIARISGNHVLTPQEEVVMAQLVEQNFKKARKGFDWPSDAQYSYSSNPPVKLTDAETGEWTGMWVHSRGWYYTQD